MDCRMACIEWSLEWRTNSVNWRPHSAVCLKCFFLTKKAPSITLMSKTHIHVLTEITMRDPVWLSSKTAKLEFPRFSGGDPTEWFARVDQFFEFQATKEAQKVLFVISTLKLSGRSTNLVFSQLKEYPISLNCYEDIYL